MNNEQLNHFSRSPINLDISRSLFSRPKRRLTTLMSGRVYPVYCEEVVPGDSVKLNISSLVRMLTPIYPVVDNAFVDVHFYFVPNRLVWEHWKQFMGENTASPWVSNVTYTIPQLLHPNSGGDGVTNSSQKGYATGTIGEHLGLPVKRELSVSALPTRAYCLIWNNYYRDQNVLTPANVSLGDSDTRGTNVGIQKAGGFTNITAYEAYISSGLYVTNAEKGAAPLPCCKLHDYFTSCLPSPQKGPSVLLPLGMSAPVVNDSTKSNLFSPAWYYGAGGDVVTGNGIVSVDFNSFGQTNVLQPSSNSIFDLSNAANANPAYLSLKADLSNATASSVNALRNAFMVQRYYERLARGGSRYFEMIRAFFGVTVPDATVQIPEFLGGRRFPINVTQVAQTSSTDNVSPQGNVSAYSLTLDKQDNIFHKSFTEHGYLIGVAMIRTEHSYSQGIPRHFSRKTFSDFYAPVFANAPEQPVYKKELFAGQSSDNDVFGYQEAWSEYRYSPSEVCGEFRPDYAQSLDSWHYGDDYGSAPTLSPSWIIEPASNVERTLAVTGHDQFMADFLFDATWVRPMPVYSIPGLLDHH